MGENEMLQHENGSTATDSQIEEVLTFGEDVHAFPVVGGGILYIPESRLLHAEDEAATEQTFVKPSQEHISCQVTQPLEGKPLVQQPAPKRSMLPVLIVAFYVLSSMAMSLPYVMPLLFPPTVTVTIIPKSQEITAHLTLSDMQSRVFAPLAFAERKTVPATGKGHQNATEAAGLLTFYNASEQAQTIEAGTLITGTDGVQVVTDQTAYLPGSVPPTETQGTIAAHAIDPGAAGNIKAGDITGACCRENIFVSNVAFSGGQDERNYKMVAQQDIQNVVSSLLPTMTQTIHSSIEELLQPHETLIQPVCSQHIISDHRVGQEAATVTVTIKKLCVAGAYDTSDYASQVIKALSEQAGKGYMLTTYLPISPVQATLKQHTLTLRATYQATVIYHFSQAEQDALRHELRGKTKTQAGSFLSQLPGVARIAITTPANQNTLPTDAASIHIVILSVPS